MPSVRVYVLSLPLCGSWMVMSLIPCLVSRLVPHLVSDMEKEKLASCGSEVVGNEATHEL